MNWWTSILTYLWRNSLRRWIEQPLSLLSKLTVAALIGGLGAAMISGVDYLGARISDQLMNRDALHVNVQEVVMPRSAGTDLGDEAEEAGWASLSTEQLTVMQISSVAYSEDDRPVLLYAVRNPEQHGYPNTLVLLTDKFPEGTIRTVSLNGLRASAVAYAPRGDLIEKLASRKGVLLGSYELLAPLIQNGYTRRHLLQARDVDAVEKMNQVVETMRDLDGRRVYIYSSLDLLLQLREIQAMQHNIAIAVTLGSALTLGLILGAMAWMEFREERYLLCLIRSFGVGRLMLFGHAAVENCLIAAGGMTLGVLLLSLVSGILSSGPAALPWLNSAQLYSGGVFGVLMAGAIFGGLLACVPVAIGLRRPLGLTLK
ncbi:MAG: hypothetical protein R3242_07015 [Akkermansiaceae bacterium]|nr:hypothetical protein [Akkermansiaceae bacterium]